MLEFSDRVLRPNDLFALRHVHEARLSPDGSIVAYVVSETAEDPDQEVFRIVIAERGSGRSRTVDFRGQIACPRWAPDGARLAFIGSRDHASRLYILDRGELSAVTGEAEPVQGPFSWSPDGSSLAYTVVNRPEAVSNTKASRKPPDVVRIRTRVYRSEGRGMIEGLTPELRLIDLRSGTVRRLDAKVPLAMRPAFSPCGKRVLFMGSEEAIPYSAMVLKGAKLFILNLDGSGVVEVLGSHWTISEAAWSSAGDSVVFTGACDSDLTIPTLDLWTVNADGSNAVRRTAGLTGNVGLRVHHDMPTWNTSQANAFVIAEESAAFATVTRNGCAEIWRISLDGPTSCRPVLSGPRSCLIMDARGDALVYCASDLTRPWDLYIANREGTREERITRQNDDVLARWPALKVEELSFTSSDGTSLQGWFLARTDRAGPQPTVLFIHGGPFLATGHAYRFDFHLLAANGYAVVFANFRGSSGYGEAFARAIMGDWGARGFPDHIATVDAAIAAGLADPARLGVWGPSHGGFATCWVVTHSDRFAAAVAESGSTDFSTMYYLSDAPHLWAHDLGGRPDEIPDVYRSRSPITYARRCRTPTLMLHGSDDLRVPVSEAEQFYRALHDAGCSTELVIVPGMNHMGDSVGPLSARRGQNEALLDWFERYL